MKTINAGISSIFGNISSILVIYIVLHWICLVRSFASEKVLYETVQSICLDPCGIVDCCYSELLNYSKYI